MSKVSDRLKPLDIKRAGLGRHWDGGGLFLQVTKSGARSWCYQYKKDGKSSVMGLGSARDVPLTEARLKAAKLRLMKASGIDPLEEKNNAKAALVEKREAEKAAATEATPFWQVVEEFHERKTVHLTDKGRREWLSHMRRYAKPLLGAMPINTIDSVALLRLLDGKDRLWVNREVMADRTLVQIRQVIDWAIAKKYYQGTNPANIKHLQLPARRKREPEHHAAMPFEDLPAFMVKLRACDRGYARHLEFCILTVARIKSVGLMTWSEIDLDNAVWTSPEEHQKTRNVHRCPLSDQALKILRALPRGKPTDRVFEGSIHIAQMCGQLLHKHLGVKGEATVHGFRTSFSLWADERDVSFEASEHVLTHTLGNKTSNSYKGRRGKNPKRFNARIAVMQDWADYCDGKTNVIQLPVRGRKQQQEQAS